MALTVYFSAPYGPHGRSFTASEQQFVLDVLNDERGWLSALRLGPAARTSDAASASWVVSLEDQAYIDATFDGRVQRSRGRRLRGPMQDGLSVTLMRERPRRTMFSLQNWSTVPGPVAGRYNLRAYRIYLVTHECGHMLGLSHARCSGTRHRPAPVMLQQTRGLGHCTPNTWPLDREFRKLKRQTGPLPKLA